MIHWYRLIRILSLDVVMGSVISAAMVVKLINVKMPWIFWFALPASVWLMYTADHLMDAHRLGNQAHTERHLFHHQNFTLILIACIIVGLICAIFIPLYAPWSMIFFGIAMGLLSVIHLALVSWIGNSISWLYHKELGVGLIYALGVWGAPIALYPTTFNLIVTLSFAQFFLLAMMNLWLFSMYELETDEKDGHTSFIRQIGDKNAQIGIGLMGIIVLVISLYNYAFQLSDLSLQLMYMSMLSILLILTFFPHKFRVFERYRAWGDGIFYFPLVYVLI